MSLVNHLPMKDTQTFLKVLDPDDTSTGGGSASAIAGSMAGSLLSMVCLISTKTQEVKNEASFVHAAAQARELSEELLEGSRADSLAFQGLREASSCHVLQKLSESSVPKPSNPPGPRLRAFHWKMQRLVRSYSN
jgi:formiminotetrahydrofolate cyclodeaminase